MRLRAAAVALTSAVLAGCGAGPELAALRDEKLADLSRTAVAGQVREQYRSEQDAGTTFGKPMYATIHTGYTVSGDPEGTFEQIRQIAVDDGWSMEEPEESVSGLTTIGDKRLNGYRGDIGMTLVPGSGELGPVVQVTLRARP